MCSINSNLQVIVLLFLVMVGIQCGDGLPDDPFANVPNAIDVDIATGYSNIDFSTARNNFLNFPFEQLSDQEEQGIHFIREEEKVALDYFNAMGNLFSSDALERMAQSEQTHFYTSGLAIDKYNLVDPAEGMTMGAFASQSLQAFYDELIREGSPSLVDAFIAGAKLQEANLVTIQNQLDRVANNRDLRNIYSALRIASRNHLRIMMQGVEANGGSFYGLFLDPSEFREIINSGFEIG